MEKRFRFSGGSRGLKGLGFLFFALLFWGSMLYVFYPVLARDWVMLSPDFPKFYPTCARAKWLEAVLAGRLSVVPLHALKFLGHPLIWQEFFFMLATGLAGVAVAYYLRTQRVPLAPACGGGLCFALSGYSFTLFCAGHGGYFYLISCGLFAFGLVNRCFQTRALFSFALLGAVLMWAEIEQPDIWLLFVMLLAAYTLWRSYREWREAGNVSFFWRVYPRFFLTGAVMLLIGFQQIRSALTESLTNRTLQMEEHSSVTEREQKVDPVKAEARRREERWIFSTNWSLPPEDMLEFIIPSLFGNDSLHMPHPYWGRLGRPHASVFQKGRMMPNYRQHVVYLGVVSVLLALFAPLAWRAARRQEETGGRGADAGVSPGQGEQATGVSVFADVPFWAGVWGVCAIISLGRYTPFYRLVYALPFMEYLRAPVKFHHLVELANACLAGWGLYALSGADAPARRLRRRFAGFAAGVAGCLVVLALVLQAGTAGIERHITELGMGQAASALRRFAVSNTVRSSLLTLAVAGVFAGSVWRGVSFRRSLFCACALIVLNTADLAGVARRCVIPVNVGPHHAANPVVKALLSRTGGRPANVLNYVTSNVWEQDWFHMALELHGFACVGPDPQNRDAPRSQLFEAFQRSPLRYWQVMGVRFVLLPRKHAEPFFRQNILAAVCDFEIGRDTVRTVQPTETSLVLAEVRSLPALPALYYEWDGPVPGDQQLQAVRAEESVGHVVADAAGMKGAAAGGAVTPRSVELMTLRKMPRALETRGLIETERAALLVLGEEYDARLEAFVDRMPVRVCQANGMWAAIPVPAGKHEITVRIKRDWGLNALSFATSLTLLGWCAARGVRRGAERRRSA